MTSAPMVAFTAQSVTCAHEPSSAERASTALKTAASQERSRSGTVSHAPSGRGVGGAADASVAGVVAGASMSNLAAASIRCTPVGADHGASCGVGFGVASRLEAGATLCGAPTIGASTVVVDAAAAEIAHTFCCSCRSPESSCASFLRSGGAPWCSALVVWSMRTGAVAGGGAGGLGVSDGRRRFPIACECVSRKVLLTGPISNLKHLFIRAHWRPYEAR